MQTDTDAASPEETEPTGGRKMDGELRVMSAMIRFLDDMDPAARRRVVDYLSSRYAEDDRP